MNKTHRIVWSEARQTYVVAHENAAANGKASSTRKGVVQAVAVALLALGAGGSALAADICSAGNTVISAAQTVGDVCVLDPNTSGVSVTVTGAGVITASSFNEPIRAYHVTTSGSIVNNGSLSGGRYGVYVSSSSTITGSISNSGSMSAVPDGGNRGSGIAVTSHSIVNGITNASSGVISSATPANNTRAGILISAGTIAGSVTNAGLITGGSNPGLMVASWVPTVGWAGVLGNITGGITNSGTLTGSVGIEVKPYSTIAGGITNDATGTISGAGAILLDHAVTGELINRGQIVGGASGTLSIKNASTVSGGIANNSGTGTISGSRTGILVASSTVSGGIVNAGLITARSALAFALKIDFSTINGVITNSGTIRAIATSSTGHAVSISNSTISGGIVNTGTIQSDSGGVIIGVNTLLGSLTNSGTISATGSNPKSVFTNPGGGTLNALVIEGANTAKFVGEVNTPNTPVTLASGAVYTMQGGEIFTLNGTSSGFAVASNATLGVAAGGTGTITGVYTQDASATFRTHANSTTFGKLLISGSTTLPASAKFEVMTVDAATCDDITAGITLAGVISATSLTAPSFATVTDHCDGINFTAVKNGNAVDLVASAAPPTTWPMTGATNNAGFGTVSCVSPVANNGTATCTASGGYYLASAVGSSSVCGTVSVSGSTITAGPVTAACTVTGTFALTAVNGTCSGANGSTVTSAPAASCSAGTPSSVSTGNTAYSWTCAGIGVGTTDSCSATRNYVVSSSAGANGNISTSQNVAYSATPSFTVAANSGYTIQSVTGCSGTLSGGNYTTAAITASCAVSASFVANVAPTFIGATTTLTVVQSAAATDVKGFLHASDSDASQTLTWTQTGTAPAHGTLSITSATAASGSADVTPGGTITYTPTAGYVGSDSFTVQVSDGTATATRSITVTVGSALTVTVGALTLNTMTVGTAYSSQSFAGAGGYGAYTYSVSAGTLPAGLSLNASTGALSGTPTTAGAYSFTIRAVDSSTGAGAPFAGTRAFSGTVAAANVAPTFVGATTTLTVAQSASAADVKSLLHASDSDASQTLTWTQNAAPTHGTLSITSSTAASGSADVTPGGTITYAPTAGYVGSDSFTVQVSDGTATATRSISVTVSAPTVTVTALTLNSMTVGTVFVSQSFAGAGGYGAYTYTVSLGTLPAGLSLNASTGALSGTPTTAGAYSFTIQAVDSSTGTGAPFAGTQAFSGTVAAAVVGNVCDPTQYPITNATKTGAGPYTFAVGGAINAGLSCNFTGNGDALTVAGSGSISTTGATNAVNAATKSVDSIQNSGLISSVTDTLRLDHSTVAQGISNSGTIENLGTRDAIFMASSTVNGGLTNGGTISGATNAITSDASTTLAEVLNQAGGLIDGRVSILSTTSVTNAGTIALPTSTISTIGGTYTQAGTGTLRTKATSSSAFGKLTVSGTAALPAAAKFDVVTGNAATCAGITAGTTLAGVISAASLSSSTFAVTDDCTNIDFTAVQSGNAINLVAVAPAPTTWVVTGASNSNSYGTVSCASPVTNNGTATCTGTASGGYSLASATGCGTTTVSGNTITAGPVTAACTVTGTFAASSTYAVTASANPVAGGSVSCTPASGIASGGSSTCSGTANPGYTFTNWGGDCSSAGSNATCTLTNITAAKSVTANFTTASTNQSTIPTTANGVTASMSVSGCTSISTAAFAAPTSGAPSNTSFPFGMLGFTLNGCISGPVTVTVTYAQPLPSGARFYKNINGTYTAYPATLGANTVTFSLTDGGSGDADGVVNGSIRDPGGLGVPSSVAQPIPTLSEWGMIFLSSLMAMFGMAQARRRRDG